MTRRKHPLNVHTTAVTAVAADLVLSQTALAGQGVLLHAAALGLPIPALMQWFHWCAPSCALNTTELQATSTGCWSPFSKLTSRSTFVSSMALIPLSSSPPAFSGHPIPRICVHTPASAKTEHPRYLYSRIS